jgi:hypothetical protein
MVCFLGWRRLTRMNGNKLSKHVIFTILIILLLIGCGTTPAEPSPEPASEISYDGTVTYDGNGCSYSGPAELPVGRHSFLFENQTDLETSYDFVYLRQGKTYQDLLADQGEPGKYVSFPDYVSFPTRLDMTYHEPTGEYVHAFSLHQEGVYVPFVHALDQGADINYPDILWYCDPIQVVEANE